MANRDRLLEARRAAQRAAAARYAARTAERDNINSPEQIVGIGTASAATAEDPVA